MLSLARRSALAGLARAAPRSAVVPARLYQRHNASAADPSPTLDRPAFSLAGKLVVITGAAQGLGLAMSQAIVASGADLAMVDRNKDQVQVQAQRLTDAFRVQYPDQRQPIITSHYANVADEASVDACIADVTAAHEAARSPASTATGPVTINGLVAAAGFLENYAAEDYPPDRMRALFSVHIDGAYFFATAIRRHLKALQSSSSSSMPPSASMVLIGSMCGTIVTVPQLQSPYNIAKAAVKHMAATLAVEWATAGIRVNCLAPGYMATAMTARLLDNDPVLRKEWTGRVPQGRIGNPPDLAGPVVFLLSDAASYVTGTQLMVDGGYSAI